MKILKIVVNGLPHVKDELNIDFVAQQRVDTYDKEHLFNVFSNIYVNRAILFIGINASGKTTILKTISFVMKLLNNQPINNIESKIIMDDLSKDEDVIITSFFYDGKNVNKLVTVITKKINETDGSEKLIIKDEKLWFKNADKVKTKKTLFVFNENDLEEIRNKNEQYLMDDVSIIVARNKKNNSGIFVCDMLEWTDHNILNVLGRFPKELLTFLDPSIEYLECSLNDKKVDIRLKFYGKEEIIINNTRILENYLSSGTIKGLGVFMSAAFSFSEGGYMIIDEIENHFNREIVDCNIAGIRTQVAAKCGPFATINEIYEKIKKQIDLTDKNISDIMQLEKKTDMDLCIARKDIAELYEYCIESGKEVYLISDMYYTLQDIKRLLDKCGLSVIDDRHIWISCEKKKDKISGSLWKEYSSVVGKNAKCIHIGDNKIGDIENSTKYGIDSYYVMSGKDMLMNSSLSELAANVNTVSDSICLGLVIANLFNSPFALCSTNGKVSFDDSEIYGYCVYGPLIEKFLIWLYYNSRKDGIDKLLFFARDGYFLEKDYKIVSELLDDGYKQDWCYLPISRRLIYMASMENEEDFKTVVEFPYVGTFADYMKSRFEIAVTDATAQYNDMHINAVGDSHNILKWIQPYKEKIMQEAKAERENYIKYLEIDGDMQKDLTYGIVDLGYYGTNQYYLQRLTNIKTKGYCFYACLSKDNVYMNDIFVDT